MKHVTLLCQFLGSVILIHTALTASAQTISAGGQHSLAVCFDGSAMGWGNNGNGQLGNGAQVSSFTPTPIPTLLHATALCAGGNHSLALDSLGQVWGWGLSSQGQVGNGSTQEQLVPQAVMDSAQAIAACGATSYALKTDGTVWAWGYGWYGQLGNGGGLDTNIPVQVLNLDDATAISAGGGNGLWAMALRADGTVVSWGHNSYGQLGNGTTNNTNTPVAVTGLNGVVTISAGTEHGLALKADGTVWAWGRNGGGALGIGSTNDSNIPVQVSSLSDVVGIEAGEGHSIAITSDSTVWLWGGLNSSTVPVQVPGLDRITEVSVGALHAFARRVDETIWTWGVNTYGQLGTGDQTQHTTPVEVIGNCDLNASVDALDAGHPLIAFPNPMADRCVIQLPVSAQQYALYDATGHMLRTGRVNGRTLDLVRGDLAPGVHTLVVTGGTGHQVVRLMML